MPDARPVHVPSEQALAATPHLLGDSLSKCQAFAVHDQAAALTHLLAYGKTNSFHSLQVHAE
jgi:hypothetical protein